MDNYVCVNYGELVFDEKSHGALNERNIEQANAELDGRAVGCRRQPENNIYKELKLNKILCYIMIGFCAVTIIASTVMTVVLDWGFFALIVIGAFGLICSLLFFAVAIKRQKRYTYLLEHGQLYFAQVIDAPLSLFLPKMKCACVIDGVPRVLVCATNLGTYTLLLRKKYIIIAYDKDTDKFLPVRVFEKSDM